MVTAKARPAEGLLPTIAALLGENTMFDTRPYADLGCIVLHQNKSDTKTAGVNEFYTEAESHPEEGRIRGIFDLPDGAALPRVTMRSLSRYHADLARKLAFPFQAMFADTRYPVRLVRYVTVVGLEPVGGSASQRIHCRVEGTAHVKRLPLVDLGLQDDDPNHQMVEDFAYWFLNAW
jgi:hypothetical protein